MAQAVHDDDMGMFTAIQRECPGDIGRLTLLAALIWRDSRPQFYSACAAAVKFSCFREEDAEAIRCAVSAVSASASGGDGADSALQRLACLLPRNVADIAPEFAGLISAYVDRLVSGGATSASDQALVALVLKGYRAPGLKRALATSRSVPLLMAAYAVDEYKDDVEASVFQRIIARPSSQFGTNMMIMLLECEQARVSRAADACSLVFRASPELQLVLVASGIDVNARDPATGATLLNQAIVQDKVVLVSRLLVHPALDPNVPCAHLDVLYSNGCLGNAVSQQRYDIAAALLDLSARCEAEIWIDCDSPAARKVPLLNDMAMPLALFERLLPFADLPNKRSFYFKAMTYRPDKHVDKLELLMDRCGVPPGFMTCVTRHLFVNVHKNRDAIFRLLRAALRAGDDPCACDRDGMSVFGVLYNRSVDVSDHLENVELSFVHGALHPRLLNAHKDNAVNVLENIADAWVLLAPYAHPLPREHPDPIVLFTGMTAEEYLELAAERSPTRVAQRLREVVRMACRRFSGASARRMGVRVVCAIFWLMLRPGWLLRHRLHVLSRAAASMKELRAALSLKPDEELLDQVIGMPVEPDAVHKCVVFKPEHGPNMCVDVVNFAHYAVTRRTSLAKIDSITVNGVFFNASACETMKGFYRKLKVQTEPSCEGWLEPPSPERLAELRARNYIFRDSDDEDDSSDDEVEIVDEGTLAARAAASAFATQQLAIADAAAARRLLESQSA